MNRNRRDPWTRWPLVFLLSAGFPGSFLITACGSPGAPAPPSLQLPAPVQDLSAARTGDSVRLQWTAPARTTDHLPLKGSVPVEICRGFEGSPCTPLATVKTAPDKPADYVDSLTGDLAHGPARLLVYKVFSRNRVGKSAGPSNPAFTCSGDAPAALTGLTAQVQRDGVLLSWHPVAQTTGEPELSTLFRITRILKSTSKTTGAAKSNPQNPTPQILAVRSPDRTDPGRALDASIQFNQTYSYTVERVAEETIAGHSVQIVGQPSEAIEVTATDVFPPAVPGGLLAAADPAEGAIDLSWNPDTENDLAGYYLYRRDVDTSLPARRISSTAAPLQSPSFHDMAVTPGHSYAYSVSAVDQSGNESARSPEVMETLPKRE